MLIPKGSEEEDRDDMDDSLIHIARDTARSVYELLIESAEETDTTATWQSSDMKTEEMVYEVHAYAGTTGIALYLADYGHAFSEDRAILLAEKALTWADLDANDTTWSRMAQERHLSVAAGKPGIALGWLRLSQGSAFQGAIEKAKDRAADLLTMNAPPLPGLLVGAAGSGILLLRLWERTGDDRYLERAGEFAQGITANQWDQLEFGMGKGLSGIGHFWLAFYELTGDKEWLELVHRSADWLTEHARPDRGFLNWPVDPADAETAKCQWCHGAVGVGQYLARAYVQTLDSRHLKAAVAAAECTYAYGDNTNRAGQCHGLTSKAELFLELGRITDDVMWYDRTSEFMQLTLGYRHETPEGVRWEADGPGVYSPDLMRGAAGVGHFCLRIIDTTLRLPLL